MAEILHAQDIVSLGLTLTVYYTVPPATVSAIGVIHVVNTDTVSRSYRLCKAPPSSGATQQNALAWDFTLAAGDHVEWGRGEYWRAGTTLQASASSANVVNLSFSCVENT